MANKRKAGKRVNGRLSRAKLAVQERNPPPDRIVARRTLFAPAVALLDPEYERLPSGALALLDNTHDAIGQLWVVGLLDHHGHDPSLMRDTARKWGARYAQLLRPMGFKVGSYERVSQGTTEVKTDTHFDKMHSALGNGIERFALFNLVVDPMVGSYPTDGLWQQWHEALIAEVLRERFNRFVPGARFPDASDRAMLHAAIRGLSAIVDGALPMRWAA